MKTMLAISIMLCLLLTFACANPPAAQETAVSYEVSASHFVKNTYKGETNPSYLLIRSYDSFESLFGVAAVMNMDMTKLITEEKMENGFVLSIIYQGNDVHEFGMEKVTVNNNELRVYYTSKVTIPDASWEGNFHITILVQDCEFNKILLYENGQPLKDALIKEYS